MRKNFQEDRKQIFYCSYCFPDSTPDIRSFPNLKSYNIFFTIALLIISVYALRFKIYYRIDIEIMPF